MKFGKVVKAAAAAPVYGAERGRRTVTKGVDAAVESVVSNLLDTEVNIDNSPSAVEKFAGSVASGAGVARAAGAAMRGHEFDAMTSGWKAAPLEETAEFGS